MRENLAKYIELTDALGKHDVLREIFAHQERQQLLAQADHGQQAAAGAVILLIGLQVLGELEDASREQRDLNFRRTGVAFLAAVLADDFASFRLVHKNPLSLLRVRQPFRPDKERKTT